MELWIRSQDKERIIKVNNIFIHQDNNHLICANQRAIDQFHDESFELGAYSSRKRALEVLDEIQSILEQINDPNLTILYETHHEDKNHKLLDMQRLINDEWYEVDIKTFKPII